MQKDPEDDLELLLFFNHRFQIMISDALLVRHPDGVALALSLHKPGMKDILPCIWREVGAQSVPTIPTLMGKVRVKRIWHGPTRGTKFKENSTGMSHAGHDKSIFSLIASHFSTCWFRRKPTCPMNATNRTLESGHAAMAFWYCRGVGGCDFWRIRIGVSKFILPTPSSRFHQYLMTTRD